MGSTLLAVRCPPCLQVALLGHRAGTLRVEGRRELLLQSSEALYLSQRPALLPAALLHQCLRPLVADASVEPGTMARTPCARLAWHDLMAEHLEHSCNTLLPEDANQD